MRHWLTIGSVVVAGGLAWAAPSGNNGNSKSPVELPSGAKLVGTAQVGEVRTFPEMNKDKNVRAEDVVGAGAVDQVYETNKDYKSTVGFYDSLVKNGAATQQSRSTTRTTTGWELQLADGGTQNVIVRNTKPTTIEMIQTAGVSERDTQRTTPAGQAASPNQDQNEQQKNLQNQDSQKKGPGNQ